MVGTKTRGEPVTQKQLFTLLGSTIAICVAVSWSMWVFHVSRPAHDGSALKEDVREIKHEINEIKTILIKGDFRSELDIEDDAIVRGNGRSMK